MTTTISGISGVSQVQPYVMAAIVGGYRNLKISTTGIDANVAISADQLVLESAGSFITTRSVNVSASTAVSGAGGLDTGAIATSTWYAVHVIYNQATSTVSSLLSLSATSPTLPNGYVYSARVGWIRTDGTANKFPLGSIQYGNRVNYKPAVGSNLTTFPAITTGAGGTVAAGPTITAYATLSVSGVVPPTASRIEVGLYTYEGSGTTKFAAVGPSGAVPANAVSLIVGCVNGTVTILGQGSAEFALETMNVSYASGAASAVLSCQGYEDNL